MPSFMEVDRSHSTDTNNRSKFVLNLQSSEQDTYDKRIVHSERSNRRIQVSFRFSPIPKCSFSSGLVPILSDGRTSFRKAFFMGPTL